MSANTTNAGTLQPCKFGLNCHRKKCNSSHPPCPLGAECKTPNCRFHGEPPASQAPTPSKPVQANVSSSAAATTETPACKKGLNCLSRGCKFAHPAGFVRPCWDAASCKNAKCHFRHPPGWQPASKEDAIKPVAPTPAPAKTQPAVSPESPNATANLAGSHPVNAESTCKSGAKCKRWDCDLTHPAQRTQRCIHGEKCKLFACHNLHPPGRTQLCKLGTHCAEPECHLIHPQKRPNPCSVGGKCKDISCARLHPPGRPPRCSVPVNCPDLGCTCLHSPERKLCPQLKKCSDYACTLIHSPNRTALCPQAAQCPNSKCPLLHPSNWCPCALGAECRSLSCQLLHPTGRPLPCPAAENCLVELCTLLHPDGWDPNDFPKHGKNGRILRTQKQRDQYRQQLSLPILSTKSDFIAALKRDRFVVVTAETGAGKTTQLPQYAAEAFPSGLVVCTEPRSIAAISVAQRISEEFDDCPVGDNVGYQIGDDRTHAGKRILVMTDRSLIALAQEDPSLNSVSVLIIDEVQERSLNTDVVLGIAKLVFLQRRDFYVVVSSATIDPKPFINFFASKVSPHPRAISVPGRAFPFTLANKDYGPDDDLLESAALISEVVIAMKQNPLGNCLVFLPDASEVDKALKRFERVKEHNWKAFPLYDGLPEREQMTIMGFDSLNGQNRMVVFCTSIAESSVTLPDIRLVVDTGLEKVSRYDACNRITVFEQRYISRSSANQRKGRAGRTAPGHCLRLYHESRLELEHAEPEIMRSSLDLVVLSICRLGKDPRTFPLLSRPKESSIYQSIQALESLGCLAVGMNLTATGRLFAELPFDPRLSSFVAYAHQHFDGAQLAAEIAALLTAPGSIFFMGGLSAEARDAAKRVHAAAASSFSSDLLFLRSVYRDWVAAGALDAATNKCSNCLRIIPNSIAVADGGCKPCRITHSVRASLNHRVLELVRVTISQVLKIISGLGAAALPMFASEEELIGRALASTFPEHIAELLLLSDPDAGAFLLESGIKGKLFSSSAVSQDAAVDRRGAKSGLLIAMSVTRSALHNTLVLDQLHRISLHWLPNSWIKKAEEQKKDVTLCFSRRNLNRRYCNLLERLFQVNVPAGVDPNFVVVSHDRADNEIRVYSPRKQAAAVERACSDFLTAEVRKDIDQPEIVSIGKGSSTVTLVAGGRAERLDSVGHRALIRIDDPPVSDEASLKNWILSLSKLTPAAIKEAQYTPASNETAAYGMVLFQNVEYAQRAMRSLPKKAEHLRTETWKSVVRWSVGECMDNALESANCFPDCPAPISSKRESLTRVKYIVRLINVPSQHVELATSILKHHSASSVEVPNQRRGLYIIVAEFPRVSQRESAITALFADANLTSPDNRKEMKAYRTKTNGSSEHLLFFRSSADADLWYRAAQAAGRLVGAEARVTVDCPALFQLESIKKQIILRFPVSLSVHQAPAAAAQDARPSCIISISGTSPKHCAKAARALHSYIAPLNTMLKERRQLKLVNSLFANGTLAQWAAELNLRVETERTVESNEICGFTLFGEPFNQGQFMSKFGEASTQFQSLYALIGLDVTTSALFHSSRIGERQLDALRDELLALKLSITYLQKESSIEVIAPTPQLLQDTMARVKSLVSSLDGQTVSHHGCVFCSQHATCVFLVCGHAHCPQCLLSATMTAAMSMHLPLNCPRCERPVSIKDIRNSCSREEFFRLAILAALQTIKSTHSHPLALCVDPSCGGLLRRYGGYVGCTACGIMQCPSCGARDDPRHAGQSCESFKSAVKISRTVASRLFEKCIKFATKEWNIPQRIERIEINPGLRRGCDALRRYVAALQRQGGPQAIDFGFFAWHGTDKNAVPLVCDAGFDPGRRKGQVHGPGEYFGQSAQVSHGYCGGGQHMIIAHVLRAPVVRTVNNFCYVVDNPTDWSYSFCLPVAVVTFGSNAPIAWIERPRQQIPHMDLFLADSDDDVAIGDDQVFKPYIPPPAQPAPARPPAAAQPARAPQNSGSNGCIIL